MQVTAEAHSKARRMLQAAADGAQQTSSEGTASFHGTNLAKLNAGEHRHAMQICRDQFASIKATSQIYHLLQADSGRALISLLQKLKRFSSISVGCRIPRAALRDVA